MKKQSYDNLQVETITFTDEDIITTSNPSNHGHGHGNAWGYDNGNHNGHGNGHNPHDTP